VICLFFRYRKKNHEGASRVTMVGVCDGVDPVPDVRLQISGALFAVAGGIICDRLCGYTDSLEGVLLLLYGIGFGSVDGFVVCIVPFHPLAWVLEDGESSLDSYFDHVGADSNEAEKGSEGI